MASYYYYYTNILNANFWTQASIMTCKRNLNFMFPIAVDSSEHIK